jgi:hypothetical protein
MRAKTCWFEGLCQKEQNHALAKGNKKRLLSFIVNAIAEYALTLEAG